ncbi:hypothetical protein N9B72_01935, partial [Bacteriovoracaceae bacterium]|nr:hypothetical protein [Bacteriovoracaceae bacterium]
MPNLRFKITDIEHPELLAYKSMRQMNSDFFIADSLPVVKKLINSKLEIESIMLTQEMLANLEGQDIKDIKTFLISKDIQKKIVGHNIHQGIMAKAKTPANYTTPDGSPIVCLDGIAKADNVGAIVRNAIGFNVNQILI